MTTGEVLPDDFLELDGLEGVNARIATALETRDFRPVVVAAISDADERFLFVQSAPAWEKEGVEEWGFVQGGIDDDEGLGSAFAREVDEELLGSITPGQLTVHGLADVVESIIPPGHSNPRGFSRGKLYFVVHALYEGDGLLTCNTDEVLRYAWVGRDDTEPYLANKRPDKKALIERAMAATL
jgi:8-oxo-dGTP pyrophosphatase MutT (NUDIX family)